MLNKLMNELDITKKLIDKLAAKLNQNLNKEGLELKKMKLGLEIVLINASKFLVVFIISAYLNLFKEALLMVVVFGSLRKSAFGIHAKSSLICTINTLGMFVGGAYISQNIKLNNYTVLGAFLIMNLLMYKYAPADTENHPLPGKKLRKQLKKQTVITGVLITFIALLVPSPLVKALMTLASSFAVINILPVTYKILNRRYRNYEEFERTSN